MTPSYDRPDATQWSDSHIQIASLYIHGNISSLRYGPSSAFGLADHRGKKNDKKRRYPACKLARMVIPKWKAMRQGRMMRETVVWIGFNRDWLDEASHVSNSNVTTSFRMRSSARP